MKACLIGLTCAISTVAGCGQDDDRLNSRPAYCDTQEADHAVDSMTGNDDETDPACRRDPLDGNETN